MENYGLYLLGLVVDPSYLTVKLDCTLMAAELILALTVPAAADKITKTLQDKKFIERWIVTEIRSNRRTIPTTHVLKEVVKQKLI